MTASVSVIVPTHNRPSVFAAIASVLAQHDAEFELIVVDDGSTDGTWPELQRIAAKAPAMCLLRTENRGVAAARNAGIAMARAALSAFLDSDDLWAPDKLARQVEFMELHPRCVISQTDEIWLRRGRRVNPGVRHGKRGGDIFIESLRTCLVSPSAAILRTACLREVGGFDEDMAAAEDYDLWLRILINHEAGYVDELLVTRRAGHPDQLSATVAAIDRFRILALLKLLARSDLAAERREAVCDILAEKCAIYANGLARRGHEEAANFVLGLKAAAHGAWRTGAGEGLAAATAAMRSHVKCRSITGLER